MTGKWQENKFLYEKKYGDFKLGVPGKWACFCDNAVNSSSVKKRMFRTICVYDMLRWVSKASLFWEK